MPPEPHYRLDGPVGLIAAGILATVLGVVAVVVVLADGLADTNFRGVFFALLGVPLGVVLTVTGVVQIRRGRR